MAVKKLLSVLNVKLRFTLNNSIFKVHLNNFTTLTETFHGLCESVVNDTQICAMTLFEYFFLT